MHDAQVLDEPVAHPVDVDLQQLWDERRARFRAAFPGLVAQVRVRAGRRDELLRTTVSVAAERPEGAEIVLDLRFGDLAHAVGVLWSLGPDVEAVTPPELRAALVERAAATARRYRD